MKSFYEFYLQIQREAAAAPAPAAGAAAAPAAAGAAGAKPAAGQQAGTAGAAGTSQPQPQDQAIVNKIAAAARAEINKLSPENRKKVNDFLGQLEAPSQVGSAGKPGAAQPAAPAKPGAPAAPAAPAAGAAPQK